MVPDRREGCGNRIVHLGGRQHGSGSVFAAGDEDVPGILTFDISGIKLGRGMQIAGMGHAAGCGKIAGRRTVELGGLLHDARSVEAAGDEHVARIRPGYDQGGGVVFAAVGHRVSCKNP